MPVRTSPTNAAQKTCRILCALSDPRIRRLTDIADATGISKVSVLRVLDTLVEEGLVYRDARSKEYRYGFELQIMSSAPSQPKPLREVAIASIERLAARSGDTVLLVARAGLTGVCLERRTGGYPIHASTLYVGSRRPLGVGSGPLAILAWLGEEEQEVVLQQIKGRLKRYPRLSIPRIRQAIQEALDRGRAVSYDEIVSQVGAIGMPVRDMQGRPIGAISISSLRNRIREREDYLSTMLETESRIIEAALQAAGEASAA